MLPRLTRLPPMRQESAAISSSRQRSTTTAPGVESVRGFLVTSPSAGGRLPATSNAARSVGRRIRNRWSPGSPGMKREISPLVPEVFSKERDQPVQRPESAVRAAAIGLQRKETTRPTRAQICHPSLATRSGAANDEDGLHTTTLLEAAFDVGFLPDLTGQLCRVPNR